MNALILSNEISKSEAKVEKRIDRLEQKVETMDEKIEVGFRRTGQAYLELRDRQGKLDKYVTAVTKRGVGCFGGH